MIGKTISQYKILEKLGEGGMGEVYLADDTELNRKVALKFLSTEFRSDPEVLARFKREAQMAAALNHPNIITVYEVGDYEGRPYIAMAYIEGSSLSELIAGELSVDGALDIARQICDGLENAHQAGVVHRDIKPDNVFLERSGRVKILDFGLAKLGGSKITGAVSTFGTIFYMSPEQVRGEEVDGRSDVFSFGSMLYEMLTGVLPFQGDHSAAIIYSITNEEAKPPSTHNPQIPEHLDRIVMKALEKDRNERYQSVSELAEDLDRLRSGRAPSARPRVHWLKYLVPTSAVFLTLLAFIIFKPFKFEFSPDQRAVAAENSLAIMYFENFVNPDDTKRLGEIVTNLLITDLSESEYMDVVSGQRLYDILKLQGKEGEKVIDKTTATAVASHAGAKWMLLGSILQEEPSLIVTSQLVDVNSGKVTASQRIMGAEGEKIFSLVDRLSNEIKQDLALPAAAAREKDMPVAQVTTHSTAAYQHYLEGVDYLNKYYGKEAQKSFAKALEYDSTFAMVYLMQTSDRIEQSKADRKRAIARAVKYADNVSEKERHYINSAAARLSGDMEKATRELELIIEEHPDEKDAYKELGHISRMLNKDPEKTIEYYRKAIEIDPMDKGSYNVLAYQYQGVGDIDNYIWAIHQYVSLAPDEANPYDSRGDLYAFSGKPEKALKSYQKALERKPDFNPSLKKVGHMYLFLGDYDKAREAYAKLTVADDPGVRSEGRALLALIPLYRGQMDEVLTVLDRGIRADEAEGFQGEGYVWKYVYKAMALTAKKEYEHAIATVEKGRKIGMQINPDETSEWLLRLLYVYSASGDADKARAVLGRIKKHIEQHEPSRMYFYWFAKGLMEVETGDATGAIASFEAAKVKNPWYSFDYYTAKAYLGSGRLAEAEAKYEAIIRSYSENRAENAMIGPQMHYYLGMVYEQTGRTGKAIEQYRKFLDIWKDADPALTEVNDARDRLARLTRS